MGVGVRGENGRGDEIMRPVENVGTDAGRFVVEVNTDFCVVDNGELVELNSGCLRVVEINGVFGVITGCPVGFEANGVVDSAQIQRNV